MKFFYVDKFNNLNKLVKNFDFESIERKEDCKFRMTKNDYVLISDEDSFEGLEKLKNVIVLVKNKEYKHIWKIANSYKVLDVIDIGMPIEYIAKRVSRLVDEKV